MIYGDDNIHDAMEKIASLPRAVRQGGGGKYGKKLREIAGYGRIAKKRPYGDNPTSRNTFRDMGTDAKRAFKRKFSIFPRGRIEQGIKVDGKRVSSAELKRLYAKKYPRFIQQKRQDRKWDQLSKKERLAVHDWHHDLKMPFRLVGAEPAQITSGPRKGLYDWRKFTRKNPK